MTLLRVYTEYSMMKGECRIKDLIDTASELSYSAVSKTDFGTLAGSPEFHEYACQKKINPIIGCEVSSFIKGEKVNLLLLAINSKGLESLNILSSFAMTDKNGIVPENALTSHGDDIVGILVDFHTIFEKSPFSSDEIIESLKNRFNHFYLGLTRLPNESEENTFKLYNLGKKHGISSVIANPVYITKKENGEILTLLEYLKNGNDFFSDSKKLEYFIRTPHELKDLFSHLPGVWENTVHVGRLCKSEFETSVLHLPSFPHVDPSGLLREKAKAGLEKKNLSKDKRYTERLELELYTIETMGFSDYFLITEDFVSFAKNSGIPVGPGRGSGVGCLTAYCLGITAVDPVENDLLFERFLNPERVTMPDFDIDFGDERRSEIINYVKNKYGKKHACGIANYSRLALRQCIRPILKYLKWDATSLINAIPDRTGITVEEALSESKELANLVKTNKSAQEAIRLCKLLEGRPRTVSAHPSGIVLTKRPVSSYVPLLSVSVADGTTENLTQYPMDTCAKLGLLKIDFLGLKYLTVIDKAKKMIKGNGKNLYEELPPQDKQVYSMLSSGNSGGVFQLESIPMRELLKKLRPQNLNELTDAISLYRPGPKMYIDSYIKGKKSPREIKYPIEQVKKALESTYGCPIYQEQIMQICRDAAGFSLGHADTVRRAMAKKHTNEMQKEKTAFIDGCINNGIKKELASSLFDQISSFAKYAFNKSHGVAYALLAYETAYLKYYFPKEYFSARLDSVQGQFNKVCEYSVDMNMSGIRLEKPCINKSQVFFSPCEEGVRYSLSAIKGVGTETAEKIVKERSSGGNYKNADDFISRLGSTISVFSAKALVASGALDIFGEKRSVLFKLVDDNVSNSGTVNVSEAQMTLSFDNSSEITYERKKLPELPETELRLLEKEYTGVDFGFSPNSDIQKRKYSYNIEYLNEKQTNSQSEQHHQHEKKEFTLYIKLTKNNKNRLGEIKLFLSEDDKGCVVRLYDAETCKTAELKDKFFSPSNSNLEKIERIMGKENVKLKASERKPL